MESEMRNGIPIDDSEVKNTFGSTFSEASDCEVIVGIKLLLEGGYVIKTQVVEFNFVGGT